MSGPVDLPKPGTMLDRYVIDERVATGGMGVVFRGRIRGAHGFERKVAMKTIHPSLVESDVHRERFLDEARIVSTIHHDNIVQVLDVFDEGGLLFLVLEWIDGPSVRRLLHHAEVTKTRVPLPVVVRVVLDVLEGLHHAHELTDEAGEPRMLVHRDVSPENIIVNEQGKSKLIDFGIAKAQGRLGTDTATGQVLGKAAFMAPEQARSLPIDRRADIWAAGAVLRLLATGTLVYDTPSQMQRMYMLALGQEPDPLPDDAPPWLAEILSRAMAVAPEERFATCADFAAALHEAGVEIEGHAGVAAYVRALRTPSMPELSSDTEVQPGPPKVVVRASIPPADELDPTVAEPARLGGTERTLPSATNEVDGGGATTEITSVLPSPAVSPAEPLRSAGRRTPGGATRAQRIALGAFGAGVVALVLLLAHAAASDDPPAPASGEIASGAAASASTSTPEALSSPEPPSSPEPLSSPEPPSPLEPASSPGPTLELDPDPVASSERARPRPAGSRSTSERRPAPRGAPSFNDYGF